MSIFGKKKQSIDLLLDKDTEKRKTTNLPIYFILGLFLLIQIGVGAFFFISSTSSDGQLNDLKKSEDQLSTTWGQYSGVANDIKQIKAKLTTYNLAHAGYSGLDEKLDKIRALVPDGVSIDSLTVNSKGKTFLVGHSLQVADAYQMVNVISATKGVTSVSLNSVSKKGSGYNFDIAFNVI